MPSFRNIIACCCVVYGGCQPDHKPVHEMQCFLQPNKLRGSTFDGHSQFATANSTTGTPKMVWVHGFARSGTSAMQEAVAAALGHVQTPRERRRKKIDKDDTLHAQLPKLFSLFEPCHRLDVVKGYVQFPEADITCADFLSQLSKCDFSNVVQLRHWRNPKNLLGASPFKFTSWPPPADDSTYHALCDDSEVQLFKTISANDLEHDVLPLLERKDVNAYVIDIVRDPRGIYASWNRGIIAKKLAYPGVGLPEICDQFQKNLDVKNDRIFRLVFDDLVANPKGVFRSLLKFLEIDWTPAFEDWVSEHFNGDCKKEGSMGTCREDSAKMSTKWMDELTKKEKAAFTSSSSCQTVAKEFNF